MVTTCGAGALAATGAAGFDLAEGVGFFALGAGVCGNTTPMLALVTITKKTTIRIKLLTNYFPSKQTGSQELRVFAIQN